MAGINLSQSSSTGGRSIDKRKFFDAGIVISGVLLFLVLASYGAIYYFTMKTDQETASLQTQIDTSGVDMKGEKIDRILAFDNRISDITTNTENQIDTSTNLIEMEKVILPSVRLTNYEYDHESGDVIISGVTSEFKFLAQQIISLKSNPKFGDMYVDKISNTESGDITFVLKSNILSQ
jgi:hypothetical protein